MVSYHLGAGAVPVGTQTVAEIVRLVEAGVLDYAASGVWVAVVGVAVVEVAVVGAAAAAAVGRAVVVEAVVVVETVVVVATWRSLRV